MVSSRLDARAKRSPRGGDRERDLRERSPPPKRDSTPPSRSRSSRRPPSPSFRGRARSCSSRPRPPSLIASFPNRSPPPPPRRTVRPSISPPSIRAIARSRSPSLANPTLAKYVRVAFDARARPSLALPFVARASLVTVALAALNISLTCAAAVRALSGPTSACTNRIVSGDVVAGALCGFVYETITRWYYKTSRPGRKLEFVNCFKLGLAYSLIADAFKLGS